MFFDDKETGIVIGVLAIIVFLILGYLSVIFIYGYGELIESTMQIRDKLCGTSTSYTSSSMGGGYTSTPPTGRYSARHQVLVIAVEESRSEERSL